MGRYETGGLEQNWGGVPPPGSGLKPPMSACEREKKSKFISQNNYSMPISNNTIKINDGRRSEKAWARNAVDTNK